VNLVPAAQTAPDRHLSRAQAHAIVQDAVRAHFQAVRDRIPKFVDDNYGWLPALRLNARGLGRDMARAPLNAALVLPHFGMRLAALGLRRVGRTETADWLITRELFLKTDVGREIEWRIWTQLLELPYRHDGRVSTYDGLAKAILTHPGLQAHVTGAERSYGKHVNEVALKERLAGAFSALGESRAAAAEVASAFACLGAGAALLGKFTPSILTLGPALANVIAANAASGGPLAALWLGAVPVKAGAMATAGATAGAFVATAAATAVSGALTDPIQRHLGLHHRRLSGMVDTIEATLSGDSQARLMPHDHYAGRIIDLVDALTAAWRFVPR
jgi:hypothetical protein